MKYFNSSLFAGVVSSIAVMATFAVSAQAGDRYSAPPNIILSSNLTAPWLLQMNNKPVRNGQYLRVMPVQRGALQPSVRNAIAGQQLRYIRQDNYEQHNYRKKPVLAYAATTRQVKSKKRKAVMPGMDPRFLPQIVNYSSEHKAGTIIISTDSKYLYLVTGAGQARRYGVGVGKQGFTWSGTEKITRKAKWPGWTPPAEMIEREKKKGRILPAHMPGGPENPLGARALYLGSTMYRIHGTTQPWSIGLNISSGCIRMRNEDVTDLYQRVKVGAKVVVL